MLYVRSEGTQICISKMDRETKIEEGMDNNNKNSSLIWFARHSSRNFWLLIARDHVEQVRIVVVLVFIFTIYGFCEITFFSVGLCLGLVAFIW